MRRVPVAQRTVLVLGYRADLTYEQQISEAMACPVGTAKSHVRRGLRELREVRDA